MRNIPAPAGICQLTANGSPDEVWAKAIDIVRRINPAFDFTLAHYTYTDVLRLFRGEYPAIARSRRRITICTIRWTYSCAR